MTRKTKSSITLSPKELKLVLELKAELGAGSSIEVVRRGLRLLKERTDRESLREAYRRGLGDGAVAALLGGGPDEVPDRYDAADPAALVPIGGRITVVHGERDAQVPVDLSRRFIEVAEAAGDDVRPMLLPDIDHFQVIDPLSPAWSGVRAAFIDDGPR